MHLKLNKPIAFIDLETTGLNLATDRIVEICILKIFPDHSQNTKTLRLNPTIPISYQASAVHGIYDKDVQDKPTFADVAHELHRFIDNSDLAGYNSNKFDIPLLVEEFLRAGISFEIKNRKTIDVQSIFHQMERRTLSAAYKFYCSKELTDAHNAEADIKATFEILNAQLSKYKDTIQNDITFLHEFTNNNKFADLAGRIAYNEQGVEVFNFGKHAGKPVQDVFQKEPSYYDWMMKGDFPMYTKKIITDIRLRNAVQGKLFK